MDKPTVEQVAWVFEKLCEHAKEGGSYRSLIYDRMGFNGKAYAPWEKAGRELHEAWRELIIVIGKSLKIDKLCDWLIKHNL